MGDEWRVTTFADSLFEIIDGDRGKNYPKHDEFYESGHCLFLNAGNVTTNGFNFSSCAFITSEKDRLLRKGKLARNDVVLTTRGTVGNSAYFDEAVPYDHIRINSGMVIIRAKEPALHSRYLYLFIRSYLFHSQVAALRTGSAQPQLPIRDINRIGIPVPPPREQRAIAHILGTLDDKIELNRRMNETLEGIARALFKSWFVDFDPVRAKAEGRQPVGMDAETAALFPDSFQESELGLIPTGWDQHTLGEYASVVKGLSYKGSGLSDVGMPMINLGCFTGEGSTDWSSIKFYQGEFKPRHTVRPGDLVMANTDITQQRRVLGSPAIVPQGTAEFLFTHHVFALRFEEHDDVLRSFVYHLLLHPRFRARAMGFATGTTVLALPQDAVLGLSFALPTNGLIQRFLEFSKPIRLRQQKASDESTTLGNLRDILLPKLISGEFRVLETGKLV